jgi:hypothetical protein
VILVEQKKIFQVAQRVQVITRSANLFVQLKDDFFTRGHFVTASFEDMVFSPG